ALGLVADLDRRSQRWDDAHADAVRRYFQDLQREVPADPQARLFLERNKQHLNPPHDPHRPTEGLALRARPWKQNDKLCGKDVRPLTATRCRPRSGHPRWEETPVLMCLAGVLFHDVSPSKTCTFDEGMIAGSVRMDTEKAEGSFFAGASFMPTG